MDRRRFLSATLSAGFIAAVNSLASACGRAASPRGALGSSTTTGVPHTTIVATTSTTAVTSTTSVGGERRYGPLASTPDANGLLLPAGFHSRVLAVGGETVPGTSYRWHPLADGGACFALDDGGWVYVNNSEVPIAGQGGASALRFDARGRVVDAFRVLEGTTWNCAGGATPWGTWLSCEEIEFGQVWECDPLGHAPARPRPAMGRCRHEMVSADAARGVVYMTEDEPDGLLYRFRPHSWGDLSAGDLEALSVSGADGTTSWVPVEGLGEPGSPPLRRSAPGATAFPGAEGIARDGHILYVSTKYDNRVSRLDLMASRLTTFWQGAPVGGPDNLAVHPATGNLFVCEDADNMEVVLVTPDGHADPFLRFVGHDNSEVTGAAFDPSGMRLIVNSQRAPTPTTIGGAASRSPYDGIGTTYMVTGPF